MPWRFYRYMLVDVLRQFAITAVILVIVIAFGSVIVKLILEVQVPSVTVTLYVPAATSVKSSLVEASPRGLGVP